MIFSAAAEPRNSGKSAKSREIQIRVDTHFETYLGYWGCLIAINLSCKLSLITTMREQCPKTTRHKLCCEKVGTSHDVKSFVIGSFLERYVVNIANDYLC